MSVAVTACRRVLTFNVGNGAQHGFELLHIIVEDSQNEQKKRHDQQQVDIGEQEIGAQI